MVNGCMDGCLEVWMDELRVFEAVVNLSRNININIWDAIDYFLVVSI
jgi:hypothetical protein